MQVTDLMTKIKHSGHFILSDLYECMWPHLKGALFSFPVNDGVALVPFGSNPPQLKSHPADGQLELLPGNQNVFGPHGFP